MKKMDYSYTNCSKLILQLKTIDLKYVRDKRSRECIRVGINSSIEFFLAIIA